MRILFYLPVITPWWFDNVVAPLLRALHGQAELHVMVAPMWRGTGIEAEQLAPLADLDGVHWHVIDADDPALFREDGAAVDGLLDLVAEIAPDLTLARSADLDTPRRFPGILRHVTEGGAPPFETDPCWFVLDEQPFHLGALPDTAAALAAMCEAALGDLWAAMDARNVLGDGPDDWRDHFGLPNTRPVLCVPLQYEHEENLYARHAAFDRADALVRHLMEQLDPSIFLALVDHPLNRLHVDRSALDAFVADQQERLALCPADRLPLGATGVLAARADAVLTDLSKSWSIAALSGTPIVHVGARPAAAWLNATGTLRQASDAAARRTLPRPDRAMARRWFSWHLGARVLMPDTLDLDRLMAAVEGRASEAQVAANAVRLHTAFEGAKWR